MAKERQISMTIMEISLGLGESFAFLLLERLAQLLVGHESWMSHSGRLESIAEHYHCVHLFL